MSLAENIRPIDPRGVQNVLDAADHANTIGRRLNWTLSISWELAGVPGKVLEAQSRFIEQMSKWLKYHHGPAVHIWVIENGSDYGLHSHIHLNYPGKKKVFEAKAADWVRSVGGDPDAGGPYGKVIDFKKDRNRSHSYTAADRRIIGYMLKGLAPAAARKHGIPPNYSKAGFVSCKRCGASQNLGPAARAKYNAAA